MVPLFVAVTTTQKLLWPTPTGEKQDVCSLCVYKIISERVNETLYFDAPSEPPYEQSVNPANCYNNYEYSSIDTLEHSHPAPTQNQGKKITHSHRKSNFESSITVHIGGVWNRATKTSSNIQIKIIWRSCETCETFNLTQLLQWSITTQSHWNRDAPTPARPIAPYKTFNIQTVAWNFRNGGEIWNPDENANTSPLYLGLRGASIFSAAGFYDMFA